MDDYVYPAEAALHAAGGDDGREPFTRRSSWKELQAKARELGLWNLFCRTTRGAAGLTNLQYAPLAEITGRVPQLAPEALNCNAPDTGNMEVLAAFGTPAQQEQWLTPLLNAEIRSAFAMTEPDVASSDARNISTSIRREGDEYVINGRKWWTTGAMDPNCKIFIVMGKTDPVGGCSPPTVDGARAARHSGADGRSSAHGLRLRRCGSRRSR